MLFYTACLSHTFTANKITFEMLKLSLIFLGQLPIFYILNGHHVANFPGWKFLDRKYILSDLLYASNRFG